MEAVFQQYKLTYEPGTAESGSSPAADQAELGLVGGVAQRPQK